MHFYMLTRILLPLIAVFAFRTDGAGRDIAPARTNDHARINAAHLEAYVDGTTKDISVSIRYEISKTLKITALPVRGLASFGTRFQNATIEVDTESTPLMLLSDRDSLEFHSVVALPDHLSEDSTLSLTVHYDIINALQGGSNTFNVSIPLIWIEGTMGNADRHLFDASVALPEAYVVQETFPATVIPCAASNRTNRQCLSLQVLPTFIRLRGHIGSLPLWSPFMALEIGILGALISTCIVFIVLLIRRHMPS